MRFINLRNRRTDYPVPAGRQLCLHPVFCQVDKFAEIDYEVFVRKDAEVLKVFGGLEGLYNESFAIAEHGPNIKELEESAEW